MVGIHRIRSVNLLGALLVGLLATSCTPYVLFASGEPGCAEPALDVNGGSLWLGGRSHANGDVTLGQVGSVDGVVSATGEVDIAEDVSLEPSDDNPIEGAAPRVYSPVDIADYRPDGEVALLAAAEDAYYDFSGDDIDAGTLASAGLASLPPGVYYTDGDIELPYGSSNNTFVAEGRVAVGGLGTYWADDPNQVLAMSGHEGGCTDPGIAVEGGGLSFVGRIVAPEAGVEVRSAGPPCGHITSSTQIVGTWVDIDGGDVSLSPLPDPGEDRFLSVGCAIEP